MTDAAFTYKEMCVHIGIVCIGSMIATQLKAHQCDIVLRSALLIFPCKAKNLSIRANPDDLTTQTAILVCMGYKTVHIGHNQCYFPTYQY